MIATAEVMFTIVPPPCSSMWGSTAFTSTTCATALTASFVSIISIVVSSKRSMLPGPVCTALFTSTSMRPHSASTRSTAAPSDARSVRSIRTASARRPSASTSAAVVSRLPGTAP